MKGKWMLIPAGVLVVMASVALVQHFRREEQSLCPFSNRQVHPGSRAVVELEGKRVTACCIRCALTARHQGQKVRLVEVSDFPSGAPLSPDAAFYVSGGPVVLCERHEPKLDAEKQAHPVAFDRCEPSIFAFTRREQAEEFARSNGGAVRRLPEILQEAGGQQ